MFAIVNIGMGSSIGRHVHRGEMEFYYCISGKGMLNDNGEHTVFCPGDVHSCADGDFHSIRNEEPCELKFLVTIVKNLA